MVTCFGHLATLSLLYLLCFGCFFRFLHHLVLAILELQRGRDLDIVLMGANVGLDFSDFLFPVSAHVWVRLVFDTPHGLQTCLYLLFQELFLLCFELVLQEFGQIKAVVAPTKLDDVQGCVDILGVKIFALQLHKLLNMQLVCRELGLFRVSVLPRWLMLRDTLHHIEGAVRITEALFDLIIENFFARRVQNFQLSQASLLCQALTSLVLSSPVRDNRWLLLPVSSPRWRLCGCARPVKINTSLIVLIDDADLLVKHLPVVVVHALGFGFSRR